MLTPPPRTRARKDELVIIHTGARTGKASRRSGYSNRAEQVRLARSGYSNRTKQVRLAPVRVLQVSKPVRDNHVNSPLLQMLFFLDSGPIPLYTTT